MMRLEKGPRTRKGFAMLLLAIAAASVCTVTVSTQSAGNGYELTAVKQLMRNEQSRWMLQSYTELALAHQCADPWPGPTAEPQLFRSGANVPFKPYQSGYTGGPNAITASPERIQVTFGSANFGQPGANYDPVVRVRMFSDTAASQATVELVTRVPNVGYETNATTNQRQETVRGTQRRTAWRLREGDPLP